MYNAGYENISFAINSPSILPQYKKSCKVFAWITVIMYNDLIGMSRFMYK
jgi:hypothetical protein